MNLQTSAAHRPIDLAGAVTERARGPELVAAWLKDTDAVICFSSYAEGASIKSAAGESGRVRAARIGHSPTELMDAMEKLGWLPPDRRQWVS